MSKKKHQKVSVNKAVQPPAVIIKREEDKRFIFGVTIIYFLVATFGLYNHEMWRDELQPWLTASSCTLSNFIDNWKVQSDTILWYTTLFLLSKISLNPVIVQIFHVLLATVSVFLILRYAPFSRINKILLCCGYFLLFEYGIIARGYCLTLFFLFLFCVIYHQTPKRHILLSFILVLLANATGGYGLVLSGALVLVLLSQFFFDENNRFKFPDSYRDVLPILFIVGAGLLFAVKSISPPDDSVYKQAIFLTYDSERFFLNIWRSIWGAFVAIPDVMNLHFWNKNIFMNDSIPLPKIFMIFFAFVVLIYCILLFSSRVASMAFYLSSTIGMLFFSYINDHIFEGFYARHYGFLFIVFVISAWLFSEAAGQKKFSFPLIGFIASKINVEKRMKLAVTILFAINAAGGIVAYAKDMFNPFSTIQAASKYIMDHKLGALPTTGFTDYAISPVAAYTRKPIYYPDRDTTNVFVIWTISKYTTDIDSIIFPRMLNFINKQEDSVLVILNFELNRSMIGDVQFTHLASFKESVVADEALSLYIAGKFNLTKELGNLSSNIPESKISHYVNLANGLLQQGKTDDAEKILNAIKPTAYGKSIQRFYNCLGTLLVKKNMLPEAKKEFQKEIDMNLQKDEAYFQLGFLYYNEQKSDSAIFAWEKTIELNPKNIDAYSNLGVCYLNFRKDMNKAEEYWNKTIQLNPDYVQGYLNLMILCQNKKDDDCMLKYLRIVLQKGVSADEIRKRGIAISYDLLKKASS